MTLTEVLAGLALLGTLLVGLILAQVRLSRQDRQAQERLAAAAAAHRLLAAWWQQSPNVPRSGTGPVPGQKTWVWQTRPVEGPAFAQVGAQVVRLEIRSRQAPLDGPALASVEVVLPAAPGPEAR